MNNILHTLENALKSYNFSHDYPSIIFGCSRHANGCSSRSLQNAVSFGCLTPAYFLFQVGSQNTSSHAGCFNCKQSLIRSKSRYQIWVNFKSRCKQTVIKKSDVGCKSEMGIKTPCVKPALDFPLNIQHTTFTFRMWFQKRQCARCIIRCDRTIRRYKLTGLVPSRRAF